MRRILFPLLVIGLAGGLFTLGSGAFFSDAESDVDNIITAGTLDLVCDVFGGEADCGGPGHFSISGMVPGTTTKVFTLTLSNGGSLSGVLAAQVNATALACDDDGANDNSEHCDVGADLAASEIDITACSYAGGACPWVGANSLDDLASCVTLDATFDASDDNIALSFTVRVNSGVGNAEQGDAVDIDVLLGLVQTGQAANCTPAD
jgi:predicted ribosomally synthesized peptide with SipW-like signal peptide